MVFVPIFLRVQTIGVPTGSLEGIDLTPFAQRDMRMMWAFAGVLLVYVIGIGMGARSWRLRLAVMLTGVVVALLSFGAVFASLLAG